MSQDQLLHLSQLLNLSPALLQSMQILQMNTLELRDYLNDLALENPVMEYAEASGSSWDSFAEQVPWIDSSFRTAGPGSELSADTAVSADTESVSFLVREQLERRSLSPELLALCTYLADLLDDSGRLEPADLEELVSMGVPESLLQEAIAVVQSLEPAGIGARSVGECLSLQLQRLPGEHPTAERICEEYLPELAGGHIAAIARKLAVSEAEVREAEALIQTLSPNPIGETASAPAAQAVRPDAWVAEIDGVLQIFLNEWDLPGFSLSEDYLKLAKTPADAETGLYLQHKIRQARWVLECIRRRQNTLRTCLTGLVEAQKPFFLQETSAPAPLLRRDLADRMQVHPSTVTRTLKHKYIQCRQGLYPASFFFSRRTGGDHSEQAVKVELGHLIAAEDPKHPLSDQTLADLLAQRDIHISRRTVAKYRTALRIPASYLRKRN